MSTTALTPAAATSKTSAYSAANKDDWKDEIHTPDQVYNANVPCDMIVRNPENRMPTDEAIDAMALTIEAEGLLQPITLRQLASGHYMIIAGETRWLAFRLLKRATIPAFIRKGPGDTAGDIAKRLIENLSRTDLPPIDKARGFKQLAEAGRTQKQIGELFGLSQPVVANAIRMLALPDEVLEMINTGNLSEAHGVALAKWAKWPDLVACMADCVGSYGWSAKHIAEAKLPFAQALERAQLVRKIRTRAWYEGEVAYKIPPALAERDDFIKDGDVTYYIMPARPEDDVWYPEMVRQDEAREAKEAAQRKKEEAARKEGKLTKEQIERRETIERNKKLRAETAAALEVCFAKLRETPAPTSLLVAIIIESAIAGGFTAKRIHAAAQAVGVTLPKGLIDLELGGQGMRDVGLMAKMDVMELTRVAVAVILGKEADDARKRASGTPDNVERVMNAKVPAGAAAPKKGGAKK